MSAVSDRLNRLLGRDQLGRLALPAAAFTVGAAVMAVEVTAARLLAPYFGTSIFVWTSLILTVLLALSVGYWLGGKLAENGAAADGNVLAALMMGAALLQAVGARFSGFVAGNLTAAVSGWSQASLALLAGSFLTAVVTLSLPMVALGSMSPLIIKLWAARSDVAKASSGYLLLSTVGGALGTLLPTLVLVPTVGSQRTIGLFSLALFLVGLALARHRKMRRLWVLIPLFAVLSLAGEGPELPGVIARAESPYQLIRVSQQDDRKFIFFNEGSGIQSVSVNPNERTNFYYDYFSLIPRLRPEAPPNHRLAVIGLSAGAAVRQYTALSPPDVQPAPRTVGVEIDPEVVRLARQHFGLDDLKLEIKIEDGRNFLRQAERSGERFQTIIVDAYSTQHTIPPHLVTREFFQLVAGRLEPGGIAAANLNATSSEAPLFRVFTNTVAAVFPYVTAIPVADSWNWLVLMSDRPFDLAQATADLPPAYADLAEAAAKAREIRFDPSAPVFTDDWAPVEFMAETMFIKRLWQN